MAGELRAYTTALKSAIQADHTATGGTYDMSGADAVAIGRYMHPLAGAPFCWIAGPAVSTDADGPPIGQYLHVATFDLMGFASSDGGVELRVLAGIDLMSDVHKAIEDSGRGLGLVGQVAGFRDVVVQGVGFDGDEADLAPGYGVFFSQVQITYHTTRGV
jgi:hypothetical protein